MLNDGELPADRCDPLRIAHNAARVRVITIQMAMTGIKGRSFMII